MGLRGETRTGPEGARTLSLEIEGNPEGEGSDTSIQTTITTVSGHFVVLGAAPTQAGDSVFVVQVLEVE